MTPQQDAPPAAPPGADQLPGVVALYEEYEAAKAARAADKNDDTKLRFRLAQEALAEARAEWRSIRFWLVAVAEAEWLEANPEGAVEVTPDPVNLDLGV